MLGTLRFAQPTNFHIFKTYLARKPLSAGFSIKCIT
jgi:hypothetical protein